VSIAPSSPPTPPSRDLSSATTRLDAPRRAGTRAARRDGEEGERHVERVPSWRPRGARGAACAAMARGEVRSRATVCGRWCIWRAKRSA